MNTELLIIAGGGLLVTASVAMVALIAMSKLVARQQLLSTARNAEEAIMLTATAMPERAEPIAPVRTPSHSEWELSTGEKVEVLYGSVNVDADGDKHSGPATEGFLF
jgi:hypothetical protein